MRQTIQFLILFCVSLAFISSAKAQQNVSSQSKKQKMLGLDFSGGSQIVGPLAALSYTRLDSSFSYKVGIIYSLSNQRHANWEPPSRLGINLSSSYHNISLGSSLHLRVFSRLQSYAMFGNLPVDFNGFPSGAPYYPMRHYFIDFTLGVGLYKRIYKSLYLNLEFGAGNSANFRWMTDKTFQFFDFDRVRNIPITTSNLGFYFKLNQ